VCLGSEVGKSSFPLDCISIALKDSTKIVLSLWIMYIGKAIRDIRIARGYSQVELSFAAGLAQNVISRIERDMHKPSDDTIGRLAAALKVEPNVFYYLTIIEISGESRLNSIKSKIAPIVRKEIKKIFF
jgi:transcriptional regulator with XRE-family HTH domain